MSYSTLLNSTCHQVVDTVAWVKTAIQRLLRLRVCLLTVVFTPSDQLFSRLANVKSSLFKRHSLINIRRQHVLNQSSRTENISAN